MENKLAQTVGVSVRSATEQDFATTYYIPPVMPVFGVPESDLDSLSDIGFNANVYLTVCSGLASAALGCVIGGLTADGVTRNALYIGGLVLFLLAIGAGLIATKELQRKDKLIDRLKKNRIYYEPQRSPETK